MRLKRLIRGERGDNENPPRRNGRTKRTDFFFFLLPLNDVGIERIFGTFGTAVSGFHL